MTTAGLGTCRSPSPPVGRTPELSYVWAGDESVSWTLNSDDEGKPKSSMMKKLIGSYAGPRRGGRKVTYPSDRPEDPDDGLHEEEAAATIVDQALNRLKRRVGLTPRSVARAGDRDSDPGPGRRNGGSVRETSKR